MTELLATATTLSWLLEPLSHEFMVRALVVSALVGGVCGLLSCYMTLKGWALMGDAVSHAVMPGVVVAYALGLPFSIGAFVFGVGSVALIGFVKQKSRVKEDTVIGLVFTGFLRSDWYWYPKPEATSTSPIFFLAMCWESQWLISSKHF